MNKLIFIMMFLFVASFQASATLDSEAIVKVPYSPVHGEMDFEYLVSNWSDKWANTKMYCFVDRMYYDQYSSSSIPQYQFMQAPYDIPVYPADTAMGDTVQVNQLADNKVKIVATWEDLDNFVEQQINADNGSAKQMDIESIWIHEPTITVDVSAYDKSTAAGRLEAITKAKLAIISIHYNLARGSFFKATINVVGLPADQSEFVKDGFGQVLAQTQYPYSKPSPLANRYYDELISEEFCRSQREEVLGFAH